MCPELVLQGGHVKRDSSVIDVLSTGRPKPLGRNGKSKKAKKAKIEILLQPVASTYLNTEAHKYEQTTLRHRCTNDYSRATVLHSRYVTIPCSFAELISSHSHRHSIMTSIFISIFIFILPYFRWRYLQSPIQLNLQFPSASRRSA